LSPRPYLLGRRAAAVKQTRARIFTAARQLLAGKTGHRGFTIEAVARQAGVARMTVYYQFQNKTALLEALYDNLAEHGGMNSLGEVFHKPDPLEALLEFIGMFIRFWSSDRLVIRCLHALSALDPEIAKAVRSQNELRREGLQVIVAQIKNRYGHPTAKKMTEAVDTLHMLTSFESFDHLASASRKATEVADTVMRLALATVVLYGAEIDD